MNVQELNYILCIAKHRNLTKAAQELYISQPTLSKYLQKSGVCPAVAERDWVSV